MKCLEENQESENEEDNADTAKSGLVVKSVDLIKRLHDSTITNEEIYKQLEKVDLQSAQKIHPNDRRKLCR